MKRAVPSVAEYRSLVTSRSNWGRWGSDDQRGAVNLITAEKKVEAARLVRSGRTVSMSRPFPTTPGPGNTNPAVHMIRGGGDQNGGGSSDWIGTQVHGLGSTHLDALCHMWGFRGIWNGKKPEEVLNFGTGGRSPGATWGDVGQWSDGIFTRGVLLDVPRFRGEPFVTLDQPVHGWELEDIAKAQRVEVRAGDALVVYSGREAYDKVNPPWGTDPSGKNLFSPMVPRAGMHATCLEYMRDVDCSVLVWDMHDYRPSGLSGIEFAIHCSAISEFGIALVDNPLVEPAAQACHEEGRYEFLFVIAPLRIIGGTGSPVNPIAIF